MFEKLKLKGKLGGGSKSKSKGKSKGKGGVKKANLLLIHGEKIGMAAVGVCVLWLLYSALGREGLDANNQPDALKRLASDAEQHIKNVDPDELPRIKEWPELAMSRIDENDYITDTPINPYVFKRLTKRTDPQLLAPVELEASGVVGLFAIVDPNAARIGREAVGPPPPRDPPPPRAGERRRGRGLRPRSEGGRQEGDETRRGGRGGGKGESKGGETSDDKGESGTRPRGDFSETPRRLGVPVPPDAKAEGRYSAIVVAKVPLTEQLAEYRRALADAQGYDPTRDFPAYMAYQVQRKEVTQAEEEWKVVESVTESRLRALTADWAAFAPPIVDERYEDPLLTFPLPLLVDREWDASVTHSDVPLAPTPDELRRRQGELAEPPVAGETGEPKVGPDGFPLAPDRLPPGSEGRPGSPGNWPTGKDGEFGGKEGEGREGPIMGMRRPRTRTPFRRGSVPPTADRSRMPDEEEVTHLLLRFFDFTVQPGRSYEYRVRLALYDPNFRVHQQFLAKEVVTRLEEEKTGRRLTDWSSPSPPVFIPFAGRMLVGQPKKIPPNLHTWEPSATVLAVMLDMKTGAEGAAEIESAERGSVGDFVQAAQVIEYGRTGGQLTSVEKFAFRTETTLLDMKGGDRLFEKSRELTAPGEYLVLDPAGRLHVQTETDEMDEYRRIQERFDLDQANAKRKREPDREEDDGIFGEGGKGNRGAGPARRRARDEE